MRAAIVLLGVLMSNAVLATHNIPYSNVERSSLVICLIGLLMMDAAELAIYVFGKKE